MIAVLQLGEYEDNVAGNSVWEDGDWNGDGEFDSNDIIWLSPPAHSVWRRSVDP